MWLSKQMRSAPPTTDADLGVTSIAGNSAGVVTRGELRSLPVYGPGGYVWLPENGAAVLVVKGGPGGEEHCVAGIQQCAPPEDMQPGEVYLYGPGGKSSIYLKQDGTVAISGTRVDIRGMLMINGMAYVPCTCNTGGV